jgi:hypothetical protein
VEDSSGALLDYEFPGVLCTSGAILGWHEDAEVQAVSGRPQEGVRDWLAGTPQNPSGAVLQYHVVAADTRHDVDNEANSYRSGHALKASMRSTG